ncbi:MAG TPA: hypothetical protein VGN26_23035 [Armatimonadota bacterium]
MRKARGQQQRSPHLDCAETIRVRSPDVQRVATMGGPGSGRFGARDGRRLTSDSLPLDIREVHRKGLLAPGRAFASRWSVGAGKEDGCSIQGLVRTDDVVLLYSQRSAEGEWRARQDRVCLAHTPCHYGGTRPWWVCPECGCRAAILYTVGRGFSCRRCCGLAYESQRESAESRALSRHQAIRRHLGGSPSLFDAFPIRPKHMRTHTYEQLRRKALDAEDTFVECITRRMAALKHLTDRLPTKSHW